MSASLVLPRQALRAAALACACGCAAFQAPVHAQVPPQPPGALSPSAGSWHLWRTTSATVPRTAPDLSICVDATGARDPALLMGEAPGDGSCQMRGTRRTDPAGLETTLSCPGGEVLRAVVRLTSGDAFVTRLEPTGRESAAGPRYVHGRRDGGCTR